MDHLERFDHLDQLSPDHSFFDILRNASNLSLFFNFSISNATPSEPYNGYRVMMVSQLTFNIVTVIYILTILFSLIGNLSVILVLCRGNRSRTDFSIFLISLALSDIIVVVFCVPFTYPLFLLNYWPFADFLCPLANFFQVQAVTATIYTMVVISIDRYSAIIKPLSTLDGVRNGFKVFFIWCGSIMFASVQLYITRVTKKKDGQPVCQETWPTPEMRSIYTAILFIVTYVSPLIILYFTYSSIWSRLKRRDIGTGSEIEINYYEHRKVWKLLVALVGSFAACWLPWHVYGITLETVPGLTNMSSHQEDMTFLVVGMFTHWLVIANSLINPIIYCFVSGNFWRDFSEMTRCRRCPKRPVPEANGETCELRSHQTAASGRNDVVLVLPPGR